MGLHGGKLREGESLFQSKNRGGKLRAYGCRIQTFRQGDFFGNEADKHVGGGNSQEKKEGKNGAKSVFGGEKGGGGGGGGGWYR